MRGCCAGDQPENRCSGAWRVINGKDDEVQYRDFGSLDFKPSALGFGAMRLPLLGQRASGDAEGDGRGTGSHSTRPDKVKASDIDRALATRMLHYAIDHGVNYVDTAYYYHDGASEPWLGEALRGGYRERVRLATKLPAWKCEQPADFDRFLNDQLERLQTDSIDFYLLHSLNKKTWEQVRDLGVLSWAEGALADGRIKHFGFSFHDTYAVFREILTASDLWTFCQIQYNYMDEDGDPGRRGLHAAAERGLGVIVMEPIRGGMLAKRPPREVQEVWREAEAPGFDGRPRTPAQWALDWVWDQPEVGLVLSGMSTLEQVEENVASADRARVGSLTPAEKALIERARAVYRQLTPIPCTACKYCLPCSSGVDIPEVLRVYNEAVMYGDLDLSRMYYGWIDEAARADRCTACGECLQKCPQKIAIPDWMVKVAAFFADPAASPVSEPRTAEPTDEERE